MVGGVELRGSLLDGGAGKHDRDPLGVDCGVGRQRRCEVVQSSEGLVGVPAVEEEAAVDRICGLRDRQAVTDRDRSNAGAAQSVKGEGVLVEIVVDRQDGVDRLAVHAHVGLDSRAGQLAQRAVDIDVMRCSVILDDRGDGGVLLGAQVLDLSVGQIIGAVGQLLDVQNVVADIDVADRGGRQFKLGVDGLVCFQNRCEVILLGEFGVGIPANERVLVLGRVSGSCNCIAVTDRDRVDGGAAVGFEGQGMLVEIILDIDRQTLFDLDVLLRVSVVGRIVLTVVLRGHSCERFKLAAQRFDLSVCLVIGAVGQLLDVADGVVVGVAGVEQLQNQRAVASDVAGGNRAGNCAVIGEVIVGLCGCGHGRVGRAFQMLGRVQSIVTIEIFQIMLDRIRGVSSGFPVGDEVRPTVDGLAGDVGADLAFAAPEGEGVAVAGRGGSVCGGQGRANAGFGREDDVLDLAVVILILCQSLCGLEVNDRNQLGDDELEILPVARDLQLGQRGGFVRLFAAHILLIQVEQTIVVPAAVDLEVEVEIAARIDLRKVERIAVNRIGGIRSVYNRRPQIVRLEDHDVDVGLFGLPVGIQGMVGHRGDGRVSGDNRAFLCFGIPASEIISRFFRYIKG